MHNDRTTRIPRSYLYVPGDRPDRLDTSVRRGADALIADLEDAVALSDKAVARDNVARWLERQPVARPHQLWVRINPALLDDDLAAVVGRPLDGVVVPKAEPWLLDCVNAKLTEHESRLGLPTGHVQVIGLIESARGLLEVARVAAAPRVQRLGIGEADLAGELRLRPGPDRTELLSIRLQVVVASAAVGIGAPVAPTSTDYRDLDAFRRTAEHLLSLGFRARTAIHPSQVAVINDVFTPSADEIASARQIVAKFDAGDGGVFVDEAGRMVDAAVVRSAHETLARAEQPSSAGSEG